MRAISSKDVRNTHCCCAATDERLEARGAGTRACQGGRTGQSLKPILETFQRILLQGVVSPENKTSLEAAVSGILARTRGLA